jgi:4-amino-4-deoxy-L-arabinose transferase-like glycosyltransferase
MGCYRLLGENAFAARLPSAVFATATALLLWLWGRRLENETAGLYAALVFITSLQVLVEGRLSIADMPMVFFFTAAVWSGWEMSRPGALRGPAWWWLFWGSLGLGFLAKGPEAWLPLGGLLCCRWLRPGSVHVAWGGLLAGMALTFAIVGLWGIPALLATHGEFLTVGIGHHVLQRSVGVIDGHGGQGWMGYALTLPFYFATFFVSFFPWSIRAPRAWLAWRALSREDTLGWYLLVQAALVFAVFTVVRTKLPHYTLPAFPCLALWLAFRMSEAKESERFIVHGLAGMGALTLAVTLGLFAWAGPRLVSAALWRKVRPYARREMKMGCVEFTEPSMVWEFRQGITNYLEEVTLAEAAAFLEKDPPRVLILPTSQLAGRLKEIATNAVVVQASGIDTVHFKRWDLTAVVRP